MPSQKQLKWSELKVGLTVLVSSITLGILILLMPRLLNFIVAIYLILVGLLGLFGGSHGIHI